MLEGTSITLEALAACSSCVSATRRGTRNVGRVIDKVCMAFTSPSLAVETTANDFIAGLSSDLGSGNLAAAIAKLEELKQLGFEGILFDTNQLLSVDELIALLTQIQQGDLTGANVAAMLLAYLEGADTVRFVMGGILTTTADLNVGTSGTSIFPAGSAG